jgi:hypothetical protein
MFMKKKVHGSWMYVTVEVDQVKSYQARGWRICPKAEAIAALTANR